MSDFTSVDQYLAGPEEMRRRELVWGVVQEPPAPRYGHQAIVTQVTILLGQHVRERELGVVCVSPADVVLDREKALIVQPDVFFVRHERASIIRDQVWGAPDLVVEVVSPGTKRYDRTTKIEWYQRYGVREAWIVDPVGTVTVTYLKADDLSSRDFGYDDRIVSHVLADYDRTVREFFE